MAKSLIFQVYARQSPPLLRSLISLLSFALSLSTYRIFPTALSDPYPTRFVRTWDHGETLPFALEDELSYLAIVVYLFDIASASLGYCPGTW